MLLSSSVFPLVDSEVMIEFMHRDERTPHHVTICKVDRLVSWLVAGVDSGFFFGKSNSNLWWQYSIFPARVVNCCLGLTIDNHHGDSPLIVKSQVQRYLSPSSVSLRQVRAPSNRCDITP